MDRDRVRVARPERVPRPRGESFGGDEPGGEAVGVERRGVVATAELEARDEGTVGVDVARTAGYQRPVGARWCEQGDVAGEEHDVEDAPERE